MAGQGGLGERLEMLKAALDNEPVGIAVLAGQDLRYVYANPEAERLAQTGVLGRTYSEVWPGTAAIVVPRLQRVLRTGEPWVERESPWHLPRLPGGEPELVYFTLEVVRYQIGQTPFLLFTTVETTEETVVRCQRDRAFAQMHEILQSVTDAICAIDADFTITYANRQASLLAHAPTSQLLGAECFDALPGLSSADARSAIARCIHNRQRVEFRSQLPGNDRWMWIRGFPSLSGAIVYETDITEQVHAEQEQRDVSETLRGVLLVMPQAVSGIDFSHAYLVAGDATCVGGDFYDIFPLDEARVGVVIGDVSEKGLAAAVTTALARSAIRAFAAERLPPGDVLERASNLVLAATPGETFFSAFYGVLDRRRGSIEYCNAGHPAPVIRHVSGSATLLQPTAPVAGAFRGPPFGACVESFTHEDLLVLYTNGLTEARSGRELFGEHRLLRLLERIEDAAPAAVTKAVTDSVSSFAAGVLHDDVALLAVRTAGSGDAPQTP